MFALPLKKSDRVRWSDHLVPTIRQVYGSAAEFKPEIEAFSHLRDSAIAVAPNSVGRDILFRYSAQLELLSLHVSLSPLRITFTWHDLYDSDDYRDDLSNPYAVESHLGGDDDSDPYMNGEEIDLGDIDGGSQRQHSVAFDKACILYNLAAVLTHLAAEAWEAQDYKTAYHNLGCAAGILDIVSTRFLRAPGADLQPRTLDSLKKFVLAQAQHCFFLKAAGNNVPLASNSTVSATTANLLAKLSGTASSMYDQSAQRLSYLLEKHNWGDQDAIQSAEEYSEQLKRVSLQWAAHAFEAQHRYGEAIACITEARRLAKLTKTKEDSRVADELGVRLKVLEKDNNLIYHERIPETVPQAAEKIVAKAQPLTSLYPTQEAASNVVGRDMFERVVPVKVHEKASLYSELGAQFVRDQQEKADVAGLELESSLEYMDLPAAISRLREPSPNEYSEVPPEVLEWSAAVKRERGFTEADFQFDQRRKDILNLISSSKAPTASIRENLLASRKSDAELLDMFTRVKSDLEILRSIDKLRESYQRAASSPSALENAVNLLDIDDSKDDTKQFDENLDKVGALVSKLRKIHNERQSTISDLRVKVRDDDITQAIIGHQDDANVESTVFKAELLKFDPIVRRIDATIRLQKSVLSETVAIWTPLLNSQTAQKRQAARKSAMENIDALTSRLAEANYTFQALVQGLRRAMDFYASLEKQALGMDTSASSSSSSLSTRPPALPQKPAIPPKGDGLNGYDTPSAYNPSMYR